MSAALLRRIMQDYAACPTRRPGMTDHQHAALLDIAACQTAACGLHDEVCDHCGDRRQVPNTCGNRACPLCQAGARARWVAERDAELLPVGYAHIVFTLPSELRALIHAFPRVLLGILMRAAADAVTWLAAQTRYLGAEVGIISVLHTWKRDLNWHPHVHLLVTAGGWDAVTGRWVDTPLPTRRGRGAFFLPIDPLRAAFQRRFRRLLLRAYAAGAFHRDLDLAAVFPCLAHARALRRHLDAMLTRRWVLRIKPPSGSPEILLRYLGRYINRVAISPGRVHAYDGTTVTFDGKGERFTVPADTFIQRFAQHVLPPGFVRIRFCGLWATRHRGAKLAAARDWLAAHGRRRLVPETSATGPTMTTRSTPVLATRPPQATPGDPCPHCGHGVYRRQPGGHRPRRAERQRLLRLMLEHRTTTPGTATTPA